MSIPNKQFLDRVNDHQIDFLAAFDQGRRFFILEWHRRAYKTTTLINLMIRECCENPKSKYVYVAPTQVWARNIVWDDPTMLWDSLPDKAEMGWKANGQKMLITFANGAMLKIGGSDEPDSLRGIDADGVGFDEWSLHKPQIWGETFRPIIAGERKAGRTHDRWAAFLYTPKGENHATMMFNAACCIDETMKLPTKGQSDKHKPGWFASRLCADDSGIIAREELDTMKSEIAAGILTQIEYDQEMQCKRATDEERTLITSAMLQKLSEKNWSSYNAASPETRKIVAIDPAFGGDMCVIKGFEGTRDVPEYEKIVHFTLTSEVVRAAKDVAKALGTHNFIVDCIGIGKGVTDELAGDKAKYHVQYFNSSERDGVPDDVANRKAQCVLYVSGKIRRLEVEPVTDPETRRQLVALSRYKLMPGSGRTIMIPNDDVKKIIGCSPDKGLSYCYGVWGLQHVQPEVKSEFTWSGPADVVDPMLM